ncbi:MAG: O-antigen ligase family protein [Phycisphaerae bacterium]|nr:O-antigen ligase family protein [Phycisphaerae bacterium]
MTTLTTHHRSERAAAHHRSTIPVEPVASPLDGLIELILIGLLAFMPLAFGAVEAWSELVILVAAVVLAGCVALRFMITREVRPVWSWTYVPMALFVLLVALQLVPLPARVVQAIAPHTAATRTQLLADLPDASRVLDTMTLSFYPLATAHNLRLILVVCVVYLTVVNVIRRPEQIKRLLAAVAAIGGAVTLIALAQTITGTDSIYWSVPTGGKYADAGPFINHSHFGQFTNLAIGAAFGLALLLVYENFRGIPYTPAAVMDRLGEPKLRPFWALVTMMVLGVASVFTSLTRGGMITMLIAASFTVLVLSSKRGLRGVRWLIAVISLVAFCVVLYVGFDAVYDRLATLREVDQAQSGRLQILKDIALAWTQFPLFGTGLGTHEVVYPMFEHSSITHLAGHAENEYAQLAEETGILGLSCAVVFLTLVWSSYVRSIRRLRPSIRWVAFGLGFGLLAVMLHSLSDFGQHIPAVICLSAVTCGLLVVLARMRHSEDPPRSPGLLQRLVDTRVAPMAALVLVAVGAAWSIPAALRANDAESSWRIAARMENKLRDDDWIGTNDQFAILINQAAQAATLEPANVKYRYNLSVFRWRAVSRVINPDTGELVLNDQSIRHTERIVDELHQTRPVCPAYGPVYALLGQLECFILNRPAGADRVRLGVKLAPNDATAWYSAGLLEAESDRPEATDAAGRAFARAIELDGSLMVDIADVCVAKLGRPDLAVTLAGDDVGRLTAVADVLEDYATVNDQPQPPAISSQPAGASTQPSVVSTQPSEVGADGRPLAAESSPREHRVPAESLALAEQARARVFDLLKAKCEGPDAEASTLAAFANLCIKRKSDKQGIDYYFKALQLDYGQVYWRFALAQALGRVGDTEEALKQAKICLRLRPDWPPAKKLAGDLSIAPAGKPFGVPASAPATQPAMAPASAPSAK